MTEQEREEEEVLITDDEPETHTFLDLHIDEKNEKWLQKYFEFGSIPREQKNQLCCPGCFTTVCYISTPSKQAWETSRLVNSLLLDDQVLCAICRHSLGRRHPTRQGTFLLKEVLPSSTSDQL